MLEELKKLRDGCELIHGCNLDQAINAIGAVILGADLQAKIIPGKLTKKYELAVTLTPDDALPVTYRCVFKVGGDGYSRFKGSLHYAGKTWDVISTATSTEIIDCEYCDYELLQEFIGDLTNSLLNIAVVSYKDGE